MTTTSNSAPILAPTTAIPVAPIEELPMATPTKDVKTKIDYKYLIELIENYKFAVESFNAQIKIISSMIDTDYKTHNDTDTDTHYKTHNDNNTDTDSDSDSEPKNIYAVLRTAVWNTYVGEAYEYGVCYCCRSSKIAVSDFHCGYVIPIRSRFGSNELHNLRPICNRCSSWMHNTEMYEFIRKCGFWKYTG